MYSNGMDCTSLVKAIDISCGDQTDELLSSLCSYIPSPIPALIVRGLTVIYVVLVW